MNRRQRNGVEKLAKAVQEAENKRKGLSGNMEEINAKLRVLMEAIENPAPDRVIDDE